MVWIIWARNFPSHPGSYPPPHFTFSHLHGPIKPDNAPFIPRTFPDPLNHVKHKASWSSPKDISRYRDAGYGQPFCSTYCSGLRHPKLSGQWKYDTALFKSEQNFLCT